jgi:hypothetical protein
MARSRAVVNPSVERFAGTDILAARHLTHSRDGRFDDSSS